MPFNRKEHHNLGEIRPRFQLITPYFEEEVFDLLKQRTEKDNTVVGKKVRNMYYLDIPINERHYWSPELRISMEKNEWGEGTFIRCVVGPRHGVWLMFVFIYGFLGMTSLFGGMYGLAHYNLGNSSSWMWCLPITIVVFLGVYITAKLGQRTGRDQMLHLVSVLYHALGNKELERR